MHVSSIKIRGFRCFNHEGADIDLDDMTCLVGPNASGKTATMLALVRLFGETQAERTIKPSDFHITQGEILRDASERELSIEVRLDFSELSENDESLDAIPEAFNQMIVSSPNGELYCRICLSATWINDGTGTGEVVQKLFWILTPSDDPELIKAHQRPVRPIERSRINVTYVPATRDPASLIRATTTTAFGRLLKAINWGDQEAVVIQRLKELREGISNLTGVETINTYIQKAWSQVYDGSVVKNVSFQSIDTDVSSLLGLLIPTFSPSEIGEKQRSAELSDGLRSLFALSLSLGFYNIEQQLKVAAVTAGFKENITIGLPLLTIFAVEEPENHLAPHYLGKIVNELLRIAGNKNAQVILSSHSPSIMRRVEPDNVRYYLGGETRPYSQVVSLSLPQDGSDEAYKYVREAVRGHPELYFSRLVVLGEGPSEEIILRKVFEASGNPLDSMFVSIVPLGGRHVNHFWRLLHGLGIPYITLLDLDREKEGAGWGRFKYLSDQLVKLHGEKSPLLEYKDESDNTHNLAQIASSFEEKNSHDIQEMTLWMNYFEIKFNVFFSAPLDIDFSMLKKYLSIYQEQVPEKGGPRLPKTEPQLSQALKKRMRQVLAPDEEAASESLGESYSPDEVPLFAWYKYLFIDGSKPVSHMRAMIALESTDWLPDLPSYLIRLVDRTKELVRPVHGSPMI